MKLYIDFNGGLDELFQKQKLIQIDSVEPIETVSELIQVLKNQYLKQKPELFVENGQLKPGILCLINDVDWEIEDRELTVLRDADRISFISTLHGG